MARNTAWTSRPRSCFGMRTAPSKDCSRCGTAETEGALEAALQIQHDGGVSYICVCLGTAEDAKRDRALPGAIWRILKGLGS